MSEDCVIHVCRFDSTLDIRGKARTYEAVKARVLEAGRFSVFEATENMKNARMFERLCKDPEVVVDREKFGFPWTAVSRKEGG